MRRSEPLSLIMMDIDYFKQYNDRYGHPAGDQCLKRIAASIRSGAKRGTDMVARIGGEEFVALLPGTCAPEALSIAERLRQGVRELDIEHQGSAIDPRVTISLGVAGCIPGRNDDRRTLLRAVDAALYRAKSAGRNRATLAESSDE
jgi:diguanylate cyclase (GGDEF)-like protein